MEREAKRELYRIHCSSEENNIEDDIEGGIGVGCAPEALWCQVPMVAVEVEAPFHFFDDSAIVGVFNFNR